MTQHYEKFEERRCPGCYNPKTEHRFNIQKSLTTLKDNIPKLADLANETREHSFERDKIEEKILETKRRIAKAKEALGIK